jgi:hypothetical protein
MTEGERGAGAAGDIWPSLPFDAWADTYATLHRWMQVVGKIRLARAPMLNHWWQATFYVTCRGLTTSPMPHGARSFQIEFDFIDHRLVIQTADGRREGFALAPRSVADFHGEVMSRLRSLGLETRIWTMPVEVEGPIPFEADRTHASYDPDYAARCWRILVQANRVLEAFRTRFLGKTSPVHFFWGGFDLAVTRFSGRRAPLHPGVPGLADRITREAYSHEVSSCGFWPGDAATGGPAFYTYAYPEPPGFAEARIRPGGAFYSREKGEFLLPYDAIRQASSPDDDLLAFLQDSYDAAANLGHWDRHALERLGLSAVAEAPGRWP